MIEENLVEIPTYEPTVGRVSMSRRNFTKKIPRVITINSFGIIVEAGKIKGKRGTISEIVNMTRRVEQNRKINISMPK